ncbi:MAG: hypothetical protein F6J95_000605 [Leptolyngbya sp. SIO1E4]|nr:hypothetical protein [Leptolyngbya sp. SIO1E4]
MSQQDNFGSGFVLGTLFGGVLGGIVGAVVTSRVIQDRSKPDTFRLDDSGENSPDQPSLSEEEMEIARRGLEDKIAQLNVAIDDVRQRLGGVNGHTQTSEDVGRELR